MRSTISVLSALFLGALLSACGGKGGAQAEAKQDETPAVAVEAVAASTGQVNATYTGTATLEARHEADVVAKVGGVIREVLVEEGERVSAGQVLARLEDERLRLEVARARAEVGKLEQEYSRMARLHEQGLVSKAEFERQKYELEALRASLESARLQLDWTAIRAPMDGIISARYIKAGNMIQANQPAFHVVNFDPLIAELHVPETELAKLAAGQPAVLRADALPGRQFQARVERINPVIDPQTGTFKVTVEVDGHSDPMLRPGLFVRVGIVHDVRENALLVPRAAIVNEDAETAVFVVRDGKAVRQTVSTGYANNGTIEVTAGLQPGDLVVTVGQGSLRDGSPVKVINAVGEDDTALADAGAAKSLES